MSRYHHSIAPGCRFVSAIENLLARSSGKFGTAGTKGTKTSRSRISKGGALGFAVLLYWVGPAYPEWKWPELPESVQVHGFLSQSYLWTTGNNFFGHSTDSGSLDFRELGINGSWKPMSDLQLSMQIVARDAGQTDNGEPRIDFGLLSYSFLSDADNLLGMRLGRVVNPFGLYNDTRDMPFTRPSIFLPQSIYFDVNRQLALSGDGVQMYGEHRGEYGDFSLQVNGVYSRTDDPDFKEVLTNGYPGSLEGKPSWVARLMYEYDGGRFRFGLTSAELNVGFNPRDLPGSGHLPSGSFTLLVPILLSAQYNAEDWSLTAEYAIRESNLRDIPRRLPNDSIFLLDTDFTGESYYFQGVYRFLHNLEGFLRYDVLIWDWNDANGKKFAAGTAALGSPVPAHQRFAKDISTGLRWDVTSSVMLRAEYHYINGTGWISELENRDWRDTEQHWHMFAVSASFRF